MAPPGCLLLYFQTMQGKTEQMRTIPYNPDLTVNELVHAECAKRGRNFYYYHVVDNKGSVLPLETTLDMVESRIIILIDNPRQSSSELCTASREGNTELVVDMLLSSKYLTVIDVPNAKGQTPLYCASQEGHVEVVIKLIMSGAELNSQVPEDGSTPLHAAGISGHSAVVAALILGGADFLILDKQGYLPEQQATGKAITVFKMVMANEEPFKIVQNVLQLHPLLQLLKSDKTVKDLAEKRRKIRSKPLTAQLQELESLAEMLTSARDMTTILEETTKSKHVTLRVKDKELHNPSESQELESTMRKQRAKIFTQLIQSEKDFVDDITTFMLTYVTPLEMNGILSGNEIKTLFSNISDILETHKRIVQFFETRVNETEQMGSAYGDMKLGDIFVSIASMLAVYEEYYLNQTRAVTFLHELTSTNLEFAKYLDQAQREPRSNYQTLEFFLTKPLQRLTSYPSFLQELIQSTEGPEATLLEEAFMKIREVVSYLNVAKSRVDRDIEIKNQFISLLGSLVPDLDMVDFMKAGRNLVKVGRIFLIPAVDTAIVKKPSTTNIMGGGVSIGKIPVFCVLFSDFMLICEIPNSGKKMKVKFSFSLRRVRIIVLAKEFHVDLSFCFLTARTTIQQSLLLRMMRLIWMFGSSC
eukprot:TRINITY_DN7468_c0_g1_i2.p1 TRINITY_DN7468_c0_g1~~TRINITY_DN7468_c0_g1_i2.p1  ORF type:complete len:657 (+),score=138.61 TRINITY_DN7468_c0_g1_i2:44-1972(+)